MGREGILNFSLLWVKNYFFLCFIRNTIRNSGYRKDTLDFQERNLDFFDDLVCSPWLSCFLFAAKCKQPKQISRAPIWMSNRERDLNQSFLPPWRPEYFLKNEFYRLKNVRLCSHYIGQLLGRHENHTVQDFFSFIRTVISVPFLQQSNAAPRPSPVTKLLSPFFMVLMYRGRSIFFLKHLGQTHGRSVQRQSKIFCTDVMSFFCRIC